MKNEFQLPITIESFQPPIDIAETTIQQGMDGSVISGLTFVVVFLLSLATYIYNGIKK
jgi:hypothetical protein